MGVPQFPSSGRFSGSVGGPWVGLGGEGGGGLASPDLGNHRQHNCHSSSHPSTGIHYSPASHHHAIHTITGIIAVSHQICCTPHPSSPNWPVATLFTIGQVVQSESTQNQTLNREKNVLILKHRVKHKIEKNNVLKHRIKHIVHHWHWSGQVVQSAGSLHHVSKST